jgi:hypothetical protein
MTQGEIEMITQLLIRYGYEAIIAGIVVFLLLKFFLPGYLTEKGKNLATTEDISKITDKIEAVKADYSMLLEELKSRHQLRIAAIDKRLEVHQEAFTLWHELLSKTHTEEVGECVMKCQKWWINNCLYLEPEVREAFSTAYHSASAHQGFVQSKNVELIKQNFASIMNTGQIIVEAVKLPRLTEAELKELSKTNNE